MWIALATTEAAGSGSRLLPLVWLMLLILAGVGLILAAKWYFKELREGTDRSGFDLEELRAMRQRGELSEEEFKAARHVVLGQTRRDVE